MARPDEPNFFKPAMQRIGMKPEPESEPQNVFRRHGQPAEVKMKRLSRWLAFVFSGLVLFPSIGSTQAPYYAGKTITVIEGNSAVSGVDF